MANPLSTTSAPTLSQEINQEAKDGVLDLVRTPTVAAIPTPGSSNQLQVLQAIKQWIDQREGAAGSVMDKFLTLRDLYLEGAVSVSVGGKTSSATLPSAIDLGSGYTDPRPSYVVPPTPTNLVATGAFRNVILTWDLLGYANFAYVEIYRSGTNARGTATLLGTSTSDMYDDANVVIGATYYYWIRAINIGGAYGADNAVGGTVAALLTIGSVDLGPLVVTAEKLSQGTYPNINLVPNPGAEDGTAAWGFVLASGSPTFSSSTADKTSGTRSFLISKTNVVHDGRASCFAFAAIPGETYSVKVRVRANVAAASGLYIRMLEKTVAPTLSYIDSSTADSVTALAGAVALTLGWTIYEYSYTVPANRYWVSLEIINHSTSTPALDVYFDDCSVGRQITASFLAADSIAVGTLAVQNGAIVNAMIANLTVDAAKIANATITNAKMAALSVDTAQIVNLAVTNGKIANLAVDTLQIANQAVTIPVAAFTAASISLPHSATASVYTQTDIQTVTLTSTGAPISILGGCSFLFTSNGAGAVGLGRVELYRGATLLQSVDVFQSINTLGAGFSFNCAGTLPPYSDTPGAGSVTYTMKASVAYTTVNNAVFTATNRGMIAIETKK